MGLWYKIFLFSSKLTVRVRGGILCGALLHIYDKSMELQEGFHFHSCPYTKTVLFIRDYNFLKKKIDHFYKTIELNNKSRNKMLVI